MFAKINEIEKCLIGHIINHKNLLTKILEGSVEESNCRSRAKEDYIRQPVEETVKEIGTLQGPM